MEYPRSGSEKFLKNRVMALSEELPLYRDTYRLLNNLLILTQDFPRFFRYSMGSRMVDLTLDMLSLIYKADSRLRAGNNITNAELASK